VVEVQVQKEIIVPVKTTTTAPRENINTYERDILVDTNVTVPVEGREFTEVDNEITDEDLNRRIQQNRSNTNTILQNNAQLQSQINTLSGKISEGSSAKYNSVISGNARLKSELNELESRLNIVQQDRERLAREVASKTKQHISYTVPNPEISVLKRELETLLNQNNSLISQVKHAANHVNNAKVV
jgi:chromosome segregation ATPase